MSTPGEVVQTSALSTAAGNALLQLMPGASLLAPAASAGATSAASSLSTLATIFSSNGILVAIGIILAIAALISGNKQTIVQVATTAARVSA
jgi:hypothetical protein